MPPNDNLVVKPRPISFAINEQTYQGKVIFFILLMYM